MHTLASPSFCLCLVLVLAACSSGSDSNRNDDRSLNIGKALSPVGHLE